MRSILILVIALLCIGAGPATTQSTGPLVKLPRDIVLGGSAEDLIGTTPVISRVDEPEKVNRLLGRAADVSGALSADYYAKGKHADVIGFSLQDGAVYRVVLLFNGDTARARRLHDQLAEAKASIRFRCVLLPFRLANDTSARGPAVGLLIELHGGDFHLARNPDTDIAVRNAIKAGKLLVGMTEAEAKAAMWPMRMVENVTREDARLVTWRRNVVRDRDPFGAARVVEEEDAASAWIEDGRVREIIRY